MVRVVYDFAGYWMWSLLWKAFSMSGSHCVVRPLDTKIHVKHRLCSASSNETMKKLRQMPETLDDSHTADYPPYNLPVILG